MKTIAIGVAGNFDMGRLALGGIHQWRFLRGSVLKQ